MDPLTTFASPPPPPPAPATFEPTGAGANFNNNVSPSVLLIIIILAIIFFISGLLHLLVRFLVKPSLNYIRDPDEFDNVTALQGQLQQLFTLHDSGVDQSFIDSLPVFTYKSIIGVNNPFDCAVCLCEFESDDNLRLLPKCSHAFHMDCIDTWLLSHSTCPLCRSNLILDYPSNTCFSPVVVLLESGTGDSFRENSVDPTNNNTILRVSSQFSVDEEFENSIRNEVKEEESKEKVVRVKLGKFKNVDGVRGDADDEKGRIDGRRCFSMGSFEYVMDDDSSLQLPIRKQFKKLSNKKMNLPITPGHRPAMSECGGDSRRDFKGFEPYTTGSGGSLRRESFSVSKIWLRGKKEKPNSTVVASTNIEQPSSTRTFSLQFLLHQNRAGDNDTKVSEMGCDDLEIQNDHNLDQQEAVTSSNQQSFAKRSLLWLMGRRKNKVVHSSMSTNV